MSTSATVIGTFVRYGRHRECRTLLLVPLEGVNEPDHCWLPDNRFLRRLKLRPGDKVRFEARLAHVQKGYQGDELEAFLHNPLGLRPIPRPRIAISLNQINHRNVQKLSSEAKARSRYVDYCKNTAKPVTFDAWCQKQSIAELF